MTALFETVRVDEGEPRLLHRHVDRMRRSAAVLGLAEPPGPDAWRAEVERCRPAGLVRGVWDGGKLEFSWREMPPQTARRLLPVRHRPEPNAAHKTVARRALSRASQMAGAAGCDDALLVDQDGYVLETSVANVFVRINDRLVTPPLDGRILPGIWRQVLIEEGGVLERRVRLEEARDAALLLTSAGADRLPATCEIDTGNIPS